ncbi:MAG TPA: hypothetical protein VIJ35_15540 [Bradyrhizobium sp.]|jgi:gluconolactonase
MMYLDAPPRLIGTDVFSAMPDAFRRKGVRAGASCTNVAIGGAHRDRLYITESAIGTVLSADIGELK